MSKKVIVFTTGVGKKEITTNALNWEDLKKDLEKNSVKYDGMKVMESINKTSLEHPEAAIPDGDFTLFLFPEKTKSGADGSNMKFAELRAFIAGELATNEEAAKAHFNEGKNYTNKSTDDLRALVSSYVVPAAGKGKKVVKATAAPAVTKKAEAPKGSVADVVNSVKKSTVRTVKQPAPAKAETGVVKLTDAESIINEVIDNINSIAGVDPYKLKTAITAVNALRPNAQINPDRDLEREAKELGSKLKGVKIY